jgi:hypothetical protein
MNGRGPEVDVESVREVGDPLETDREVSARHLDRELEA